MKNKVLIISTLLLIGIAFWVLNYLTPEYFDDYFYKYMFWDNIFDTNMPITSIKDILISQYNHYFGFNGRTVIHIIVQLFTGILGKDTFNIINTIIFLSFIYIFTLLCTKATSLNLFFSCSIILLLYPSFKETALWMTGSINYMWTSMLVCLFLYVIEKHKEDNLCVKSFLWGILCIFIGWTHEGFTFPLSISLIIFVAINYKNIYKQSTFPMIVGFLIGSLLCSFAPGTLNRTSNNNVSIEIFQIFNIKRFITGVFFCIENLKAFNTLLCTTIILLFIKEKPFSWIKDFYKQNYIIYNALFASFGIIFCLGCQYIRAAVGTELFSLIILLRILQHINIQIMHKIKIAVCIIICILYSLIVYYSIKNYQEYKFILSQIKNTKESIILTNEYFPPSYVESYILSYIEDNMNDTPFSRFSYSNIENRYIAATYNRDCLAFMPIIIYNDIINQNDNINDIQKQERYSIYIIPANKINITANINPTFILTPTDFPHLPFYIRPIAHKMLRYTLTEMPASRYDIIKIKGQDYLFIGKNKMIDDRVKAISLKE